MSVPFFWTYFVYSFIYFIFIVISFISFKRNFQKIKKSDVILRSFLILTLLAKSGFTMTQGVFYGEQTKFTNWKVLITKLPGTFVTVFYSIMLCNWFEIIGGYFGGSIESKFKLCKIGVVIIVLIASVMEILFMIYALKNYNLGSKGENYVSLIRDSILFFIYVGIVLFIRKKFEIPCTFSTSSQEQLIYFTSLFIFLSLLTRVISASLSLRYNRILDECGKLYLFMFSFKELLGRAIPLGFIIITDYYLNSEPKEQFSSVLSDALMSDM